MISCNEKILDCCPNLFGYYYTSSVKGGMERMDKFYLERGGDVGTRSFFCSKI